MLISHWNVNTLVVSFQAVSRGKFSAVSQGLNLHATFASGDKSSLPSSGEEEKDPPRKAKEGDQRERQRRDSHSSKAQCFHSSAYGQYEVQPLKAVFGLEAKHCILIGGHTI